MVVSEIDYFIPDWFQGFDSTVDDIVNSLVGRMLARLGFENELYYRWLGISRKKTAE